jgi:hypothetical protein
LGTCDLGKDYCLISDAEDGERKDVVKGALFLASDAALAIKGLSRP